MGRWRREIVRPDTSQSYQYRDVGPVSLYVDQPNPGRWRGWATSRNGDSLRGTMIRARSEREARRNIEVRLANYLRRLAERVRP